MQRRHHLDRFYSLLDELEDAVGGKQKLKNSHGRLNWPARGVYFFFHSDEQRARTGQLRLTRIGTHAVSEGSSTSLWDRLRTHRGAKRGTYEGGGNHRGSVFRKRVGEALVERDELGDEYPDWGSGSSAGRELRLEELEMERRVSQYIRELPFLWVRVDDQPGTDSDRAFIERNAIALASNFESEPVDVRAEDWLGYRSPVHEIRDSGLWNINHVSEGYDPAFLDALEGYIDETPRL